MVHTLLRRGLLFVTTALLAWPADAPPRLSLEELTAQSDAIVAGRVARTWAGMDSENRFIWTHYEVSVRDTLKGAARATVVMSEPGGVLDGRQLLVTGSTRYAIGEDVAVFLYRTPIGFLRTTNYGQGKIRLLADGSIRVSRLAAGTNMESAVSWDAFRARVGRIVSTQQAVRR